MTTDPKALIERLESKSPVDHVTRLALAQALRDLTAERDKAIADLVGERSGWETVLREELAEVARLKALGDGLAEAGKHSGGPLCMRRYYKEAECTCGLSAALAAWETRDA